jgi:flagellar capping protein FliD
MFKLNYMYYGIKEFIGTYDEVIKRISELTNVRILGVRKI